METMETLFQEAEGHTKEARERWGAITRGQDWESGRKPKVYGMNCLQEEIGKLARCLEKLTIATDPSVRDQWDTEARYRMVTAVSMLGRLWEVWAELPDNPPGYDYSPGSLRQ